MDRPLFGPESLTDYLASLYEESKRVLQDSTAADVLKPTEDELVQHTTTGPTSRR